MSKTLVTIDNILPIATGIQGTPKRLPYMAYEDQQQITRLCVRCGLLLMQYGAE